MAVRLLPALLGLAAAAPTAERITSLPGYGKPPSPQYSGWLKGGNATSGGMSTLHYWFAAYEGKDDWRTKPVVLWLNGGPGSSSLLGFMQEAGPLLVGQGGALVENPWSWNKVANVFALEAPGGVGFSYCEAQKTGGHCGWTDKTTAKANANAVRDFFVKFPELADNDFFITGESYAGVYCPTLARELVDGNDAGAKPRVNLVGMAVGDPCTDNAAQKDSMDMLWYGHKHGFVPDDDFTLLWNECGSRVARDVDPAGGLRAAPTLRESENATYLGEGFINDVSLYGVSALVRWDVPGSLNYEQASWLNSEEVRAALHVSDAPSKDWPGPSDAWVYESSYAACSGIARDAENPSMIDFYAYLAPKLPGAILVFNGDTDPCVSYEGTRTAIKEVGFAEVNAYRPWFFNATAAAAAFITEKKDILFGPDLSTEAAGPQLGGHVVDYDHGLSFATVHGSGHMVPQFRPRASLTFIAPQERLAPPLGRRRARAMSDDDDAFPTRRAAPATGARASTTMFDPAKLAANNTLKDATARVVSWIKEMLPPDIRGALNARADHVMINAREVACGDPDCSPIDVVLALLFYNGRRAMTGLPMEMNRVRREDIASTPEDMHDELMACHNDTLWVPPSQLGPPPLSAAETRRSRRSPRSSPNNYCR
ncbi:peptidase [Aureococcus anophagefferens]|nr:peptidase [Aureococcus anophagefferens]